MNQDYNSNGHKWLRAGFALTALLILMISVSFTSSRKLNDELWKQLGISRQEGENKIRNSFLSSYLDHYGAKGALKLAAGSRAQVSRELLLHAKSYLNSTDFITWYENERKQAMPEAPAKSERSKEDIRKEKIEEMKKGIASSEELIKKMPEMEKDMKPTLEMFRKMLKDYEDPKSETIENYYQAELQQHEYQVASHKEDLVKWEQNFPKDHKMLIARQLKKYIEIAATVDFNAKLEPRYGKMKFVNPAFEGKGSDWKMIYRAGVEVYNVTKPFAEQWLKEIQ